MDHPAGAEGATPTLLDGGDVAGWLARVGLVRPGQPVTVTRLAGGVSSLVLAASAGRDRWVLKQSLPRLLVADDWSADPVRQRNEAAGLAVAARLTPGAVPAVAALDTGRGVLGLQRAPAGWVDWRDLLLAGRPTPDAGRWLGAIAARWHTAFLGGTAKLQLRFTDDARCFEQLRLTPFHRTVADRVPELRADLEAVIADLVDVPPQRRSFVHGDLSPKNVLLSPDSTGGWVIDFEVAHVGDPLFDVAFLGCSLLLEPMRDPATAVTARCSWTDFVAAYTGGALPAPAVDWSRAARHVGALLLARVHGRSPDRGLGAAGRVRTDAAGRVLLRTAAPTSAGQLWDRALAAADHDGAAG